MRLASLILVAVATILLGWWSFSGASFNVEVLEMLPEEMDAVHGMKRLQDWYREGRELIIVLETDEDGTDDLLSFTERLTEVLRLHPEVSTALSKALWEKQSSNVAELVAYTWWNGQPERVQALAEALAPGRSEERIAEAIDILGTSMDAAEVGMRSYDPLGLLPVHLIDADDGAFGRHSSQYVSEDGLVRSIFIKPSEAFGTYRDAIAWIESIRNVVEAEAIKVPELESKIQFTGEPAFLAEISGGMERDLSGSVTITVVGISLLFFLMHRVVMPLVYLIGALTLIFVLTFASVRLLFSELNVMSIGFAAILIGLTVDYGVVIFQESKIHGGSSALIRKRVGPAILWAAATTAAVFVSLSLSSLPGIAQLGTMVAVGIVIGAVVMLTGYVALAARIEDATSEPRLALPRGERWVRGMRIFSVALILGAVLMVMTKGLPKVDSGFEAMRPKNSEAMQAMELYQEAILSGAGEQDHWRLPLLVEGQDEEQFRQRLTQTELWLAEQEKKGVFEDSWLPLDLWPQPDRQQVNAPLLTGIASETARFADELRAAGFEEEVVTFLNSITDHWRIFGESDDALIWPKDPLSLDLINRMLIRNPDEQRVLGFVKVPAKESPEEALALTRLSPPPGVYLTGWEILGPQVMDLVRHDFPRVFLPMAAVLVVALGVAYRRLIDLAWTGVIMIASAALLVAAMSVSGMRWNFLNLCAIPVLFGTSLDYSIHMLLAMRRHSDRPDLIRRGVGRALIFCGVSTAIGFGSLALASNQGLASFGIVCALGILATMVVSVIFLPLWCRLESTTT